jgi:predicted RNA binding protein YcfA (HicA-like mRNA interferase family)
LTHIKVFIIICIEEGGAEMGKIYSSSEVIQKLRADGWYLVEVEGDHHQFKHSEKKGKVTVQHPKKELSKYNVASIARQAGLDF